MRFGPAFFPNIHSMFFLVNPKIIEKTVLFNVSEPDSCVAFSAGQGGDDAHGTEVDKRTASGA